MSAHNSFARKGRGSARAGRARRRGAPWPLLALLVLLWPVGVPQAAPALASETVAAVDTALDYLAEGRVEAVRQSQLAAQVAGRVTALKVRAGEKVLAGQLLLAIDPSVAAQQAAASRAQVAQGQALLDNAQRELTRARRLAERKYLSRAALERAEAQYAASAAQAQALIAQAGAAGSQTGFHSVHAPYAGWVAAVDVVEGELALPGKPLLTLYDPQALRVSVRVPESVLPRLAERPLRVELPAARHSLQVSRHELLPAVDPASHTAELRIALPERSGVLPGQFARVWLPLTPAEAATPAPLSVPESAVVRRGELAAVYVLDPQGRVRLRQLRLGATRGGRATVLAGLSLGERVVLDPAAAAAAIAPKDPQ